MKKNALAISIALLSAAPSFATASVWGRPSEESSQQAKQVATPEKTTIGFLGRMVTRSHDNQPAIPPSTLPSLTGATEPTTLVELQEQPDFATTDVVAPSIKSTADNDPALDRMVLSPPSSVEIPNKADTQMIAANTINDQQIVQSASMDAEPQIETSATIVAADTSPSLFHRFLDYIIPSVTPEQEVAAGSPKATLATEVLPVKDLPDHMPAPAKAVLLVDGPVPEGEAAQAALAEKVEAEKQERVFVLSPLMPIHTQLQEWASESGWTLEWKLNTSWITPVATTFSGTYQSVIERVIDGLHSEGKQIKLIVWANNYAEVVDVSTR